MIETNQYEMRAATACPKRTDKKIQITWSSMERTIMLENVRDDIFARERCLRRLAKKRGYTLVRPWAAERRGVGGLQSCYVLVPQNSGLSLEEVEAILKRNRQQGH
jgi:hypothetical protein